MDLADFAALQACVGQPADGDCGAAFEFVVDGVIDIGDCPSFVNVLGGPQ